MTRRKTRSTLPAGVRRQVPMAMVVAVVVIAALLVASDRWRRGAIVLGISTLLAGSFRLILPTDEVGLLAVRSKGFDVSALFAVGFAIVWLAASIDPLGTG